MILNLIIVAKNRPKVLNEWVSLLYYIPCLLLAMCLFDILYVFMLPLAYFFSTTHKFILLFRKTPERFLRKLIEFLMFLLIGPLILVIREFFDSWIFVSNSLRLKLVKQKQCYYLDEYISSESCF